MLIAPSRTEIRTLFKVKVSNLDLCIWGLVLSTLVTVPSGRVLPSGAPTEVL